MDKEFYKKQNLFRKLHNAYRGAWIPFKSEVSIRIQVSCALAGIALGWYLKIDAAAWIAILVAISLVLITEMLNTAIEKLVDVVSPGYNETAGKVKDIAAGAVFIAGLVSLIIAAIVFIPFL